MAVTPARKFWFANTINTFFFNYFYYCYSGFTVTDFFFLRAVL